MTLEKAFRKLAESQSIAACKRVDSIKKFIQEKTQQASWQIGLRRLVLYSPRLNDPLITRNINVANEIVTFTQPRFAFFDEPPGGYAVMGSSFVTSRANIIDASVSKAGNSHSLDAYHIQHLSDGVVFALADGCGGHFGDDFQDLQIKLASQTAVQHACNIGRFYTEAEEFKANATDILKNIGEEIKRVSRNPSEQCTLLITRAFYTQGMVRIISINVGDGLLAAYHPAQKWFKTLAPTSVYKGVGTAMLPNSPLQSGYRETDILVYDTMVPRGTILLPMSDGVSDNLPKLLDFSQSKVAEPSIGYDLAAHAYTYLDDRHIAVYLSQRGYVQAETCVKGLCEYALDDLNKERQSKLALAQEAAKINQVSATREQLEAAHFAQQIMLGDDFTIMGIPV